MYWPPLYIVFLRLLASEEVRYLLLGGHAVAYYAGQREPRDLDVWIPPIEQNEIRLVRVLTQLGFPRDEIELSLLHSNDRFFRIKCQTPPLTIDFMSQLCDFEFHEFYSRRHIHWMDDWAVDLLNIEDLIVTKKRANREKDQPDLAILENLI